MRKADYDDLCVRLLKALERKFDSATAADAWLNEPNDRLDGRTPVELIDSKDRDETQRVHNLVCRLPVSPGKWRSPIRPR